MQRKILVFFLLPVLALLLFIPGCSSETRHTIEEWEKIEEQRLEDSQREVQYKALVLEVISDEVEESGNGPEARLQVFEARITNGPFKGDIIKVQNRIETESPYNIEAAVDKRILISPEFDGKGRIAAAYLAGTVKDRYILILALLFVVVLVIVGKMKGLRAALALAITAAVVIFGILPLILKGYNPILVSSTIGIGITIVTLLIISGINRKTLNTIIGTSCGILIGGLLALIFGNLASLTGLSSEEAIMLAYIPQNISFDYRGILFAGILLASLGAVMDVSMSISSSMFEILKADPTIKKNDFISAGMNVGRDIIGTMSNTLILVYIGSALPLMLLFLAYDIPFMEIINKDIIASEIIRALSGSIGLIMAIPITVFLGSNLFSRRYLRKIRDRQISRKI